MAEIYAIEAACDTYQPGTLKQGSAACTRSKSMRTALTLGAENPRVLFINALCSPDAEGDPGAIERWRGVVASSRPRRLRSLASPIGAMPRR